MRPERSIIYFEPSGSAPSDPIAGFARDRGFQLYCASSGAEVGALLNRSFPACVVLDARTDPVSVLELCRSIKADEFFAIVPVVVQVSGEGEQLSDALEAGADEVVGEANPDREKRLRLELLLRRADRDVSVHPTTRLPGTVQIERDMIERMGRSEAFAVCYADLDHFKEFNDRYGYNNGDQVILLVSRMLRDLVRGLAPDGFVGHIGGDDFIFNLPVQHLERTCDEVIQLFDELIPYQYTEDDRRAGYFLGKDRRGSVHRIPLMTLSIGVVTDQILAFSHTAQISELAAEMKTYAKSLPGSLYVVDRRHAPPDGEDEGKPDANVAAPAASGPAGPSFPST